MTRLPTETQFIGNVWGLRCTPYWYSGGKLVQWTREPSEAGNPYVQRLLRCVPLQKGGTSMGVYAWTSPGQVRVQGKRPWLCRFTPITVQKLGPPPPGSELVPAGHGRMKRREELRPQLAANLSWAVDCAPMPRRRSH